MGAAKAGYETITGQFAIGTKLCAEPRVDPLLTVTYAYLEKGVVTQAISGPFDLGRPTGLPPDAESGGTRLNPKTPVHHKKHKAKKHAKKKVGRPRAGAAEQLPPRPLAPRTPSAQRGAAVGLEQAGRHALDLGDRGEALAHLLHAVVAQAQHPFFERRPRPCRRRTPARGSARGSRSLTAITS